MSSHPYLFCRGRLDREGWGCHTRGMSRYLTLCFLVVVALGASAAELIDPPKGASIAIVGGGQG